MNRLKHLLDKKNKLVLWIGSGISVNAGCYLWEVIENQLTERLPEVKIDEIKHRPMPQKFSYYRDLFADKKQSPYFYSVLNNATKIDQAKYLQYYLPILNAIKLLPGEPPPILTTNIDSCLEHNNDFMEDDIFYEPEKFDICKLIPKKVFHLHGWDINLTKNDTVTKVWLDEEYRERYQNPNFKKFLQETIKNRNILFLGSSIEREAEDLFLEQNRNKKMAGEEIQHFALFPKGKKTSEDIKFYEKMCGIKIIEYGSVGEFSDKFIGWINENLGQPKKIEKDAANANKPLQ